MIFFKAFCSGDSNVIIVWESVKKVKEIALSQTTDFGHFGTVRVCRQQYLNIMKMAESSLKG